jgi:hypothetical protein
MIQVTAGRARWIHATCGVLLIGVLYSHVEVLKILTQISLSSATWGPAIRGLALPYATWCLVLAMLLLVWATRLTETIIPLTEDLNPDISKPGGHGRSQEAVRRGRRLSKAR